jgi:hypothetical protein
MYRQCSAKRRAGQFGSNARSNRVPTSLSLDATRRSQSTGIVSSRTESGWYAHVFSSAGSGSTGFVKPLKDSC